MESKEMEILTTGTQKELQVDPQFSEMEETDLDKAFQEASQKSEGGKASDEPAGAGEKQLNAILPHLHFKKKVIPAGQKDPGTSPNQVEKGILEVLLEELGEVGLKGKLLILCEPASSLSSTSKELP